MTLDQFVRHAQLYGTDMVYETAQSYLPPIQCGWLVEHLRRLDKRWSLDRDCKERLLNGLLDAETSDKTIRELLGISQPTLRKYRVARTRAAEALNHAASSERNGEVR